MAQRVVERGAEQMVPSIMEETGLSREDAYLLFVHNVQGNLAVNRLLGWRRGPSSPMRRSCSAPIPKGACEWYRLVTIPVVDLYRMPFQAGDVAMAPLWFSMLYKAIAIVLSFFRELEQVIWSAGD